MLSGCALPNRLGLVNSEVDPLEKLTREDLDQAPSPYPTALSNPHRPQVLRPVAPAEALVPPTVLQSQLAASPGLPLQQSSAPAMALNPQQLAGRLPVRIGEKTVAETGNNTPPETKNAEVRPPAPVVLTPASTDVSSLLAAKEVAWPELPAKVMLPKTEPAAALTPQAVSTQPAVSAPPVAAAQPASPVIEAAVTPPKSLAVDEPEPAESIDSLLPKLIASVEQEIRQRTDRKETDDLPALQQKLRLLHLVAERSDDAVEKIDELPPAEREAYKQLMFALSTWLSPDETKRSSLRNAKVLRALHEADSRLSAVSKLDLKNLIFCEKVESFGWYTEFPRAEFAPKQQVILYVEVQNFAAEEKTATSFETELQGSYQIFDAAGNIVDERQLPLDREICRNFRRDYFLAYRIYLPGEISVGRYRLELTIEDLKAKKDFKGRKQGEAMIEFAVK